MQKHDGSDSEGEESDEEEAIPQVEIDASKLTPLSPEVISKQVRCANILKSLLLTSQKATFNLGVYFEFVWVSRDLDASAQGRSDMSRTENLQL